MQKRQQFLPDVTLESLPNERFREVFRYWQSVKADKELPPQSAINPTKLPPSLLPRITITAVEDGPKRFRIKLVGDAIVQALGENATGRFTEDVPGAEGLIARHIKCVESRRPYYSEGPVTWSRHDFRSYAALVMPFAAPDGDVRRILTYTEYT